MRVLILFLFAMSWVLPAHADEPTLPAGEPVVIGRTYTIASKVLGADRRISIRLPADYAKEPDRQYPVVYVIDGGPEQDFPHLAGLAQAGEINFTFTPFILVGVETVDRKSEITPPVKRKKFYKKEFGAEPGGASHFRQFLQMDVMPWVNSHYRSNGHSAVMGESLAGLFVMDTLFAQPDLFDDYVAISPSLWWDDMRFGKKAHEYVTGIGPGKRRLYLTIADEGLTMRKTLDAIVAQLVENAPDGMSWVFVDRQDFDTHQSIYHDASEDAWRLMFAPQPRIFYADAKSAKQGRAAKNHAETEAACGKSQKALWITPKEIRTHGAALNGRCVRIDWGRNADAGNWAVPVSAGTLVH